jgi:hypothetical protein
LRQSFRVIVPVELDLKSLDDDIFTTPRVYAAQWRPLMVQITVSLAGLYMSRAHLCVCCSFDLQQPRD